MQKNCKIAEKNTVKPVAAASSNLAGEAACSAPPLPPQRTSFRICNNRRGWRPDIPKKECKLKLLDFLYILCYSNLVLLARMCASAKYHFRRNDMKRKILSMILILALLLSVTACGGKDVCQHRDADDNGECDKCGESYEDGDEDRMNNRCFRSML